MSSFDNAILTISHIDELAGRDRWMNRLHPLVKLFAVIIYISFTMATDKYDLERMIILAAVPVFFFIIADLEIRDLLTRFGLVIPIIFMVGIVNVFLDKGTYMIGGFSVRAGVISMITLVLKGIYAIIISYVFVATTTIEKLCTALRKIKVPAAIVTQIMLTYRYLGLLLEEAGRVMEAYYLRAPGQKGVAFSVWGSLVGQMLLRSFDRAQAVYESMKLRGYE